MAPQKCRFLRRGGSSAEPTVAVSVETVEALMNTLVAVRENASFLCVELPVFLLLFAQNDAALLFFFPNHFYTSKRYHLAKTGSGQT